jgi:flagellar FliL protein
MESAAELPPTDLLPDEEAPKRKALPLLAVVAIGLMVGGGVGLFVAGPLVAKRFTARLMAGRDSLAAHRDEKKAAKEDAAKVLYVLENLVLNPAQSGGTRFLMVTAAFEIKDAPSEEMVKQRDAEMRDALLSLLGRKTVEELTDMSRRDTIKREVMNTIAPIFPAGTVKKVFFPQFVIQ